MDMKPPQPPAEYTGPERRARSHMTEEQIDDIAERAAKKAVSEMTDMVYREVGKGVVKKVLFLVGAAVVGAVIWAKEHNLLTGH